MNVTCGWYITAPENHIVSLYLKSADWSNSKDMGNVEVYDVDESELIPIAIRRDIRDHDSPNLLGEVFSKFRSVFVVFKSDGKPSDFDDRGIFGQYSAVKPAHSCSSKDSYEENMNILLRDPSGTIKTPGYPQGYSDSFINNCFWKIIAPKGRVVRIDFMSFSLATFDYVTITDSINGLNPQSITRSGKQASFMFYSTGHELSIKVHSYSGTSGPGFIANYTSVPAVISGTCVPEQHSIIQVAVEGLTFSTPGFPSSYSKKGVCSWNITVPAGDFIKLTFWKNYGECNENYVKVYDVTNSTRISLGKFCKKYREQAVYSKGNNLLIKYTSLRRVSSNGFVATYESLKSAPAVYSCLTMGQNSLEDTRGEFASYEYPLHYSNNIKCSWVIHRPAGFIVQLTFHSFNLQQSQDCEADYVEIKQGEEEYERDAKVIGRFCGSSLPSVILSNQSNVFVDFVTDISGMYPGFHASYKVLPNPAMGSCNNPAQNNIIPLTGETGSLFSPLYPRDYPNSIMCTWVITVPEGHFVKLRIKFFHMGYRCGTSSLQIRDGQSSSSNLMKKFCGQEYESAVFSSGRYLLVQFDSNKQYSEKSLFDAVFEAVKEVPAPFSCTSDNLINQLSSETGTLASYNYPLPYDDSVECVWIIYVHSDYKIKLSFDFFNLSQSSDCSDDYVEVHDGQFDTSDLIGKFCGSEKPESITSDDRDLHVTFKSSGKTKYPGFKASYETKYSTGAIMKIVGYCVGGLAALIALIGCCIKCYMIRQQYNAAMEYIEADGTEGIPLQEQATKL